MADALSVAGAVTAAAMQLVPADPGQTQAGARTLRTARAGSSRRALAASSADDGPDSPDRDAGGFDYLGFILKVLNIVKVVFDILQFLKKWHCSNGNDTGRGNTGA